MKIAIIGSGNIATFFSKKFHEAKFEIVQIISASAENAKELATQYDTEFSSDIHAIDLSADIILFAVKDDIISNLTKDIDFRNKILIHTAGSVTLESLASASKNIGCIWSMYSINKNHLPERKDIPLIINASNEDTLQVVSSLARCISDSIYSLNDDQKLLAHLAAVFANNFANHMFTIGQDILQKENIPFDLLIPLIENTVEKLMYSAPDKLQTGPAIRNDKLTLEKHKALLKDNKDYLKIYDLLSESIREKYLGDSE